MPPIKKVLVRKLQDILDVPNYQGNAGKMLRINNDESGPEAVNTTEVIQDTMAQTLQDTSTIDFSYDDVTGEMAASVKDDSIDKTKINADIAGLGLSQDTDGSLKINVGTNIQISTDSIATVDNPIFSKVTTPEIETTNDLLIDCGTEKTLVLDKPVYNDINFEALILGAGASAPSIITLFGSGNIKGYAFDGNAITEMLDGGGEILHDYKQGTDIIFHVHWMPTTNNTGNVKWQLEYSWFNFESGTIAAPAPTTISVTTAAAGVAWVPHVVSFSPISGTGKHIGSHIMFRFFRDPTDAADTYSDDAALLSVGIHYQIDTLGSRQIAIK